MPLPLNAYGQSTIYNDPRLDSLIAKIGSTNESTDEKIKQIAGHHYAQICESVKKLLVLDNDKMPQQEGSSSTFHKMVTMMISEIKNIEQKNLLSERCPIVNKHDEKWRWLKNKVTLEDVGPTLKFRLTNSIENKDDIKKIIIKLYDTLEPLIGEKRLKTINSLHDLFEKLYQYEKRLSYCAFVEAAINCDLLTKDEINTIRTTMEHNSACQKTADYSDDEQ